MKKYYIISGMPEKIYKTKEEAHAARRNMDIDLDTFSNYFSRFVSFKDLLMYAMDKEDFKLHFYPKMHDAIELFIQDSIQEVREDE